MLGNISATNISLSGQLDLQKTAGNTLTGSVAGTGTGELRLNTATHAINGTLNLGAGDKILTGIVNPSTSGEVVVSGAASNSANSALRVSLNGGSTRKGSSYTIIIGGAGSSLNKISDSNIIIDKDGITSTSNRFGSLAFSTRVSGDTLYLDVSRYKIAALSNSKNSAIYDIVTENDSASGSMLALQNYLDSDSNNDDQKNTALESANSQVDNSTNRINFDNLNAAANLVSNRLESVRNAPAHIGKSSGDEPLSKAIWIETFGTKAKQSGGSGYKANSNGLAIGFDKKFDKELTLGVAGIHSSSTIKATGVSKKTRIESNQINLYSGHNFENFFVNNLIGIGLNQYNSTRNIEAAQTAASAKYSGRSYVARSEIGTNKKLADDFILTPTFMLTAARNSVDSFNEDGAGTLNLHVKNDATNFFEARAGSAISKDYKFSNKLITPSLSASYGYDLVGAKQKTSSSFIGQSTSFSSSGSRVAQGSWKLGAGLKIYNLNNFSLNTDYNFEHRSGFSAHTGSLRGKYVF